MNELIKDVIREMIINGELSLELKDDSDTYSRPNYKIVLSCETNGETKIESNGVEIRELKSTMESWG